MKDSTTYSGGGGLCVEDGIVTFKGSASFVGNQAEQYYDLESEGMLYYAGQGGGLFVGGSNGDAGSVVFEGPVFFTGNTASVRALASIVLHDKIPS